jgi:hypothetical protein
MAQCEPHAASNRKRWWSQGDPQLPKGQEGVVEAAGAQLSAKESIASWWWRLQDLSARLDALLQELNNECAFARARRPCT